MALPWQRRDNRVDGEPGRRRRNRRRDRPTAAQAQQQSVQINTRLHEERRRQALAITVGSMLILAIIAIVAVGYYREFYAPPRDFAGNIRGVEFTMGDLVERIQVLQGINRYQGGFVDLSIVPFQYLQDMLNNEILRQAAPGLGLNVTQEDVDQTLKRQFYPPAKAGEEVDTDQLDRLYDNNLTEFLTQIRLSESEYRRLIEEQLLRTQLTLSLSEDIPETPEQVELEWIRIDFDNSQVDPGEVRARLDSEDFVEVAFEVNNPAGFANSQGYVGWVPQGAFPDLDPVLFGDTEQEVDPLGVGSISNPQFTQEGAYIIHKISGPDERELDPLMRAKLSIELVKKWQAEQLTLGSTGGWVKINFNSERYAWVADQVRLTAPRVDQPQRRPNPGGVPLGG